MALEIAPTKAGATKLTSIINNNAHLELKYMRLGTAKRTPDGNETDITTPFVPDKRFEILVAAYDDNTIAVWSEDDDPVDYNFSELGVFDEDDVLFAYASVPSGSLSSKSTEAELTLITQIRVEAGQMTAITFSSGVLLSANHERHGIVRLATEEEFGDGTSDKLVASVKTVAAGITRAREPIESELTNLNNLTNTGYYRFPPVIIKTNGPPDIPAQNEYVITVVGFANGELWQILYHQPAGGARAYRAYVRARWRDIDLSLIHI